MSFAKLQSGRILAAMGRSRQGDATGYLWLEEGVDQEAMIAEVAPVAHTSRCYSYVVPANLETSLTIGRRVLVPLGRRGRLVQGFVVGCQRQVWDTTLRPIDSLVDAESFLTPHLIELGRRIAEHYCCPLGRTLKAITPEAVRRDRGLKTVRYARLAGQMGDLRADGRRISSKQLAMIDFLARTPEPVRVDRLLHEAGASSAPLRSLIKNGLVDIITTKEMGEVDSSQQAIIEPDFELNEEQRGAVAALEAEIRAERFSATLLFGVSGSGKTEVYIHAMRRVIADGKQAILLVPEIMLTTQLVDRLSRRFPSVAVTHSGQSATQRSLMWREVAVGRRTVVVGTRSAVFAPCPNLGLICVDEEQETSYKNLQAPRFHTRDVALLRGQMLNIPVVLGSATPSLETWHNSGRRGDYRRLILSRRVKDLPLPKVHLVDMRDEFLERKSGSALSLLLQRCLTEALDRGEQALILMNRRGFASRVFCPACKGRLNCPNCHVGLVVHAATGMSICHYCRTRIPTPTLCPTVTCREKLVHVGLGTQSVEAILRTTFPQARIQRVDRDTMRHRRHYQAIVDDFAARRLDVLVGTQMIAKGLDFPGVSVVGVLHADASGMASDFRGHERLFQLITQVAGRAGRADATGVVVVQAMNPDLPALACALGHNYESFACGELKLREQVGFPPFRYLARIIMAHRREQVAAEQAEVAAQRIRAMIEFLSLPGADVLGPTPCSLLRLRGRYRHDLLVRAETRSVMRQLTGALVEKGTLRLKVESVVIDVDPVSLA